MLDCRGLACPQPVMRAKEEVEADAPQRLEVLVDNQAASENVSRFLSSQGYVCEVAAQGGDYVVRAVRDASKTPQPAPPAEDFTCAPHEARTTLFITADRLGRGDDALGAGLMKNFILTLPEMAGLWRLVMVNSGVKLCCQGSESIEALQGLAEAGVSILVCGTCLNHFGLMDQKQVGETTNMLDVVTSLAAADKVVTV